MRFSPWYPIAEARRYAPQSSGVLQARGTALLPLPRGKSAMCLYAATAPAESLAELLGSTLGAELLSRAAGAGAHLVRFAVTEQPAAELSRLERDFQERFGALPVGNRPVDQRQPPPQPQHLESESRVSQKDQDDRGISYRDAGVDIDAGEELVNRIKPHVARTMRPEVLSSIGGFAGLCALPKGYRDPVLVACTDGVGTKLKLAFLTGKHHTVGIDLVAMNVNDMVVSG